MIKLFEEETSSLKGNSIFFYNYQIKRIIFSQKQLQIEDVQVLKQVIKS